MSTAPIAEFFDREACCKAGGGRKGSGVSGVSKTLLHELEVAGFGGRTVLDLGCGTGDLSLEMLARGASRATGIDLSPRSVELARAHAREAGLMDRAAFYVNDAAAARLTAHDVVVLDKVLCCYPDAEGLAVNALGAARFVYGFSLPASGGFRGLLSRIGIFLENAWRWLRRDSFRAYVHDVSRIDDSVRAAGFSPVRVARRWVWHVGIYAHAPE